MSEAHNCPSLVHRVILFLYIVPVTVLNLILLAFIRYRTPVLMRQYKLILYTTTAIDFSSAWCQFLIGIRPTLENDQQTFNFDGFLPYLVADWPIFAGGNLHYLSALETFMADFSFAFGIVPFLYRYFAVCWDYQLRLWQFLSLCFVAALLAAYSSFTYAYISADFYAVNVQLIDRDLNCLRPMPSFTAIQSEGEAGLRNFLIRGWFYGLAMILYSYSAVIFCGYRLYVLISKSHLMHMTERSRLIGRQLTLTIGLQALCPLIITGGSLIFLYIGIKAEFYKEKSFMILFYSFMIFPFLNPIISIYFISSYRRALIDLIKWCIGRRPYLSSGWNGIVTRSQ
ncbi:hypothetical protein M3Y96_00414200 [Aphelenchoides besseyi]|nr:hypothetical protein M3Y96_00414200 [Aphelenchoides besseyi]